MIGLGSNRLSVCRRGGMSVTQAGRGGMEWLAGDGLRGRSPYSDLATAALKAQFQAQWPTIRDYGFAHPEIVGYMNAYAPEDAKIAYSLVPTLGVIRWLVGNGSSWIDTGLYANSTDIAIETLIKSNDDIAVNSTMMGMLSSVPNIIQFLYCYPNVNTADINFGTRDVQIPFAKGVAHTVSFEPTGTMTVDGTDYNVGAVQRTFSDSFGTIPIFAYRLSGGINYIGKYTCSKFNIRVGTQSRNFVPFIHKDNGTDKYGMIDLLTGTFYGDATGNNGFTISETPSS